MTTPIKKKNLIVAALAVATAAALAVTLAIGSGGTSGPGNATDVAFADGMAAHHQGAVEMARVALEQSDRPEIEDLARSVIETQSGEMSVLERIGEDLHHMDVPQGHMDMDAEEMGMGGDMEALRRATPFDRAFIDAMIAHHRGAIRMARRQLAEGDHAGLATMSRDILAAQTAEIGQLRAWRARWYGATTTDTREPTASLRSLTVMTGAEPRPSTSPTSMNAQRLEGPVPARTTVARVLTDEDCAPDAAGVSHCRNAMRLEDGRTLTVRHPHRMVDVACMTPGEKVRVTPA